MRHPWHAWVLFALGAIVVLPVMGLLTVKVRELDLAESLARRQAEREELVGRALWRMDSRLSPVLAQEAARPPEAYAALAVDPQAPGGKGARNVGKPSPLFENPPEFVKLHFELHGQEIFSPQCPPEAALPKDGNESRSLWMENLRCKSELSTVLAAEELPGQLPPPTPVEPNLPPVSGPEANPRRPQVVVSNYKELEEQQLELTQRQSDYFQSGAGAQTDDSPPQQAVIPQTKNTTSRSSQSVAPLAQQPTSQTGGNRALGNSDNDLYSRNSAYQALTQNAYMQQRFNGNNLAAPEQPQFEGLFRPLWLQGNLILARQVRRGDEVFVQGCWLDWTALQTMLRAEAADLLPEFEFTPVLDPENPSLALGRVLATLPVQITLPPLAAEVRVWSPVQYALAAAWTGILLAAIAAAVTLASVIALSERRAAFVAAVTHELRTPLTTFRMYAEMLAEGMVPDPAARRRYLDTLRTEADRLAHLVDNVLQYARLERGRPGKARQVVSAASLAARMEERAGPRAREAGMELSVVLDDNLACRELTTDPAAVEQIVFNLIDNACKYAAHGEDKRLEMRFDEHRGRIRIQVRDYGPGIPPAGRRKLFAPFSKSVHEAAESAPGVGLGLALSRRLAEAIGGNLTCESTPGQGAVFTLELR